MKKWMGVFLTMALTAQLTACGQGQNAIKPTETTIQEQTTAATEAETTAETETTEAAENGAQNQDETLNEIHTALKEMYGEMYIPSMSFDETMLAQVFNVDPAWCEAYIAEGPMMSAHVDTFVGIKAAEGMADSVEKSLLEYQEMLIENSIQYPMNQLKVEASQVVRQDDYVFFVLLGQIPMDIEDEEAGLQAAKDSNQEAVDLINEFFE